jgi:hypothetical protein
MIDSVRNKLYRAITTSRGDGFGPLRIPKDLARRVNTALGRPLAPTDELVARRDARQRLETLRTSRHQSAPKRVAAPVLVYFEKDRNANELRRIKEALDAKAIAYKLLDVAGDEATLEFVTRKAGCKEDELPVVFVADKAIGNFPALVEADVSGALEKAIYGA